MKNLPLDFLEEMKELLPKDEYDDYILRCEKGFYYRGIRINTLKCTAEKATELLPFPIEQNPFCSEGYYIPSETEGLGSLPLHHAGAFYAQEPSAMSAVTVLDPKPGDKVLDLCAAPGGKSTQIASALEGSGLLWSNEIVKNRANVLLSNMERMGVTNAVVSNCHPDMLCRSLAGCFDISRDNTAVEEWSAEHSRSCAVRQLSILESAAEALKEGGTLVYSTCTFSRTENEDVVEKFLALHSEFELEDCAVSFGRRSGGKMVRVYPADGGEGHFAAKMRKKGDLMPTHTDVCVISSKQRDLALSFYDELFSGRPFGDNIEVVGDKVMLLPKEGFPAMHGLGIIRAGLMLGEIKKNRIEPHHSLFMASKKDQLKSFIDLSLDDERIIKFLKGEEIAIDDSLKGYTAVFVEGIALGFGKAVNGVLKNKYPKGLRMM